MINNIENVIKYGYKNHKKTLQDILDCVEMLQSSICDLYDQVAEDVHNLMKDRKMDEVGQIQPYLSEIIDVQNQIETLVRFFSENDDDPQDDVLINEQDEDEELKNEKIDYSLYAENQDKPHMIYENYEHKKICAFMLEGKKYVAKNWQDALVTLCELMAERDYDKLVSFIDMDEFSGRKVKYFGKTYVEKRNCLIDGTDIYVWINLSANSIRNVMKKILKHYNINSNSFYIYLRADYTALHKGTDNKSIVNSTDNSEKIGKYVRLKMKELEQKNYIFNSEMMKKLLDKNSSKSLIGINLPFFKEYDNSIDVRTQVKDENGNSRFWKEKFSFNGKEYFITSQWYEYNRQGFDDWYKSLK